MKPDWDKLGTEYKGSRSVVIADVDCTQHQDLCGKNGVQGYPTIKVFYKDGPKSGEPYNGGRDFNALKKFVDSKLDTIPSCSLASKDECHPAELKILEESEKMAKGDRGAKIKEVEQSIKDKKQQAKDLEKEWKKLEKDLELWRLGGEKPEKVEQLLTDADFREHCGSRTCVLAFLPHILDDGAAGRKANLKIIEEIFKKNKGDGGSGMLGFMWLQGGDNFEIEEKLQLQFGFPAIVGINLKKEKYGVHRGVFSADALSQFLQSLKTGKVPLAPLPKSLGTFAKSEPWDGKDAAPPAEDEEL